MRRTKILATLGPASAKADVLEQMIKVGLDAVRLNFSHGSHEAHEAVYRLVREASQRAGRPVAVLLDLQGPKIRIGKVKDNLMQVPTGSQLVITSKQLEGCDGVVSTEYTGLSGDVVKGDKILLDEGRLTLFVKEVRGGDVICDVADGGVLSSKKGINVPGAALTAAAMTDKDRADAVFGLKLGVDFIALSFVRRAKDVEELRALMLAEGRVVPIIAKIEKPQAIECLDEIIAVSEGVMVARGDLGVEVSLEMVPAHQKRIIAQANRVGKLVITATQMLESMTDNPIPTRAEVTDVANAILDGTDAIMLSGETAVGKHPVETVRRMSAIAETTEETLYPFDKPVRHSSSLDKGDLSAATAGLAANGAHDVDAKAIVVFTKTGRTATLISDDRPRPPIFAFTADAATHHWLSLYWGVVPQRLQAMGSTAELLASADRVLLEGGHAKRGDTVVYVIGTDTAHDATNSLRIARLGDG